MKTFTKKALATILSLCFILSVVTTTAFALPEFESRFEDVTIPDDYAVTAIVVFEDASLSEMGYTPADIQAGKADKALSKIQQKQATFADELNGKGDICYKYTSVINGAAVDTTYSQLKEIEKIDGVKKVYIANTYEVPDVEQGNANITGALELVKETGYNGDGVTIAVLDTGTHTTHEAFQDYGIIKEPSITKEDIDAFEGYADPKYISVKIPFAYDYADGDDDVTDITPATSGHGTHCAGIALGYAERDGEAYFTGTAPAAQLVAMKIFKDDVATTNSGIYFAALDDCYTLGVDIVSMSIGADYGFTYDDELEDEVFGNIFETLDDAGIIVCVSAGNSGNQSESSQNWLAVNGVAGYVLAGYTDYGTVGSPAAYKGNIGVASIDNATVNTDGFMYGNTVAPFFDNGKAGLGWYETFEGQEPGIVFIDGIGDEKSYVDADGNAIDVAGKIAVVSRGETSFQEKHDLAASKGAIGIIVYNNASGYINMQIDSQTIPAVSTTQDMKAIFAAGYAEGQDTISVTKMTAAVANPTAGQVSSFSGWGPTPDLRQVPQIAGVGGYVYSASYTGDQDYIMMSGTSMACPNTAGMFALMLDALRDQYPEMDKKTMAELAENKAISTAAPTTDADGYISPVVQQGSGIFQPKDAIDAKYYFIDPISDGIKNASAEGIYTFDITVARTHGEGAESFDLIPYIMSDYPAVQNWGSKDKPNYHIYNSFSSIGFEQGEDYTFAVDTESGKVEFADGETEVTVSVTITLKDGAKEFIETYFENGIYVYGYIYLATEEDEVAPHATFLGYYGDFDASPAAEFGFTSFEMVDIDNFLNSPADDKGNTYADYGYEYYWPVMESDLGYTLIASYGEYSQMGLLWHLGGSVFASVPYDESHNAISSVMSMTGDYFADCFVVQPIVYRNLRHLIMEVYAEGYGDEPVYVDDTEYVRKSSSEGNYATFQWGGELYDEDGFIYDYVASGTKATVKFYAQLDYEGAELKQVYEFDVLVDYDAPDFIYHYDAETRTIKYEVSDMSGIQYFEFYDADLTTLYSVDLTAKKNGEVITGEFVVPAGYDVIGYSVMDFATNYTESSFATDRDSTNKTYKITTSNVYGKDGYVIEPQSNCGYEIDDNDVLILEQVENSEFMFTIDVMDGYTVTDDFKVSVDGEELTAEDGVYSFTVTKDVTIEVEGIEDITAPEITIYDPNDYSAIEPEEGKDAITAGGSFIFSVDSSDEGTGVVESGFAFSDTEYDYSTDEAIAELIDALDWNTEDVIGIYSQYGIGYIYAYAIDGAGNIAVTSVKVINDTKAPTFTALITEHGTKAIVSITDEMSDIASVSVIGVDSDYVATEHGEDASVVTISGMPNGTYEITVIAEDAQGNKSEFKFTLEVEYVPELITDDLYLVGLHETQTVADLKAKYSGAIAVYDKDGKEMADTDRVTTGCTIKYCGSTITIIVKGDLNRDGKVTIADATLVKRSIMGYVTLDDQQLLAGTVAGSGTVTIRDYTLIKRHIQGFISIYGE